MMPLWTRCQLEYKNVWLFEIKRILYFDHCSEFCCTYAIWQQGQPQLMNGMLKLNMNFV